MALCEVSALSSYPQASCHCCTAELAFSKRLSHHHPCSHHPSVRCIPSMCRHLPHMAFCCIHSGTFDGLRCPITSGIRRKKAFSLVLFLAYHRRAPPPPPRFILHQDNLCWHKMYTGEKSSRYGLLWGGKKKCH